MQSQIRGLKVPVPDDEALVLGFDGEGIASAIHFGFDDEHAQFVIWAVACALRTRGRGYGRQAIGVALSSLRATKLHYDLDCGVFTHIDPRNSASREAFRMAGFEYLDQYDGYEGWVRDI